MGKPLIQLDYRSKGLSRRTFLGRASMLTAGICAGVGPSYFPVTAASRNRLPRWRGFNLLDFFSPNTGDSYSRTTDDDFKWMVDWGFDFVRLPMAYPRYVSFDRSRPITPDETCRFDDDAVGRIQSLVERAQRQGLHVSLNLHRAPGYCVNAGFQEPFNLWQDADAQEAFYRHWAMWARRFRDVSREKISFDLVNEPSTRADMNDQHAERSPVPGEVYRKVAKRAAEVIREQNPNHLVIADGNDVGSSPIPEIADLDIAQSCRGYFPHYISHYQAPWVFKNPADAPPPVWPGEMDGKSFSRKNLEDFYRPWIQMVDRGVGVHCGECGCWKKTPHPVFLAWFGDVLDILTEAGIGYALWNFRGDFGMLDSGRTDIEYEEWYGHKLDGSLLQLLKRN